MLFNSIPFAIFFIIFFLLYWFVFNKNLRVQNFFLLIGSYVFYGWWDWGFLLLLIGNSLLNFLLGYYMEKAPSQKAKNILMYTGTFTGLGLLLYFKYVNFFITSFIAAFARFNIHLDIHTISLILPLGISFYTFRSLSYLFDINKGKIKPTSDWIVFFSFVAFFPCLLSGPIDKAKTLVPQLEKKRQFIYADAADAMRQILWGLFKKVVIADRLTLNTNYIYDHYQSLPASTLLLGAFYFSIQLYTDFSGYSDMAIGFARLLGFNVTKNFNFPFFAQNIGEFWRKWHISLTSWLTDYVFTPLNIMFRDYGKTGLVMAIIVNFTLIGLWHGANWTFVLFGLVHGCYFIPLILNGTMNKNKKIDPNKKLPSFTEAKNMLVTFILVTASFIIFRADNIKQAIGYFARLFSKSLLSYPKYSNAGVVLLIIALLCVEWIQRNKEHVLQIQDIKWRWAILRWTFYAGIVFSILYFGGNEKPFIYFNF